MWQRNNSIRISFMIVDTRLMPFLNHTPHQHFNVWTIYGGISHPSSQPPTPPLCKYSTCQQDRFPIRANLTKLNRGDNKILFIDDFTLPVWHKNPSTTLFYFVFRDKCPSSCWMSGGSAQPLLISPKIYLIFLSDIYGQGRIGDYV